MRGLRREQEGRRTAIDGGMAVSPSSGFTGGGMSGPYGIAVDGTGK